MMEAEKNSKNIKAEMEDEDEDTESKKQGVPWKEMTGPQKARTTTMVIIKLISFLATLYVFFCSLGLLESAFQLLGGRKAGEAFSSGILSNPFAGLMLGVLATVMMQSSSTSTSIIVTMVGSGIIPTKNAVPIVMGANIGTSVTNTLVSLAQANDRKTFRRAFSGATVHDMFNWLSVIVLLPIEIAFGYLHWLSGEIVDSMGLEGNQEEPPEMLKAITEPLLNAIVEINKDVIRAAAVGGNDTDDAVLLRWCKSEEVTTNIAFEHTRDLLVDCTQPQTSPLNVSCANVLKTVGVDPKNVSIALTWMSYEDVNETKNVERCDSLFAQTDLSDSAAGAILLVVSIALVLIALFLIVALLKSLLSGSVQKVIKKSINADFPGPFSYFTGYVAFLVGVGMTIIVQSSSVFTSTLTPLVGLGIVSVDRMYPMTLGSNVGTTVTSILAAMSQSGDKLKNSLRISMCHLFFNVSGILLFYPIPFTRFPVGMAKILGKITSKHRWFAVFYLVFMFVIFPGAVFGLSYAGYIYLAAIGGPLFLAFLVIVLINVCQKKKPGCLPSKLRTWDFLPNWMHSLKPVDRCIEKIFKCKVCQSIPEKGKEETITMEDAMEQQKIVDEETNIDEPTLANGTTSIPVNGNIIKQNGVNGTVPNGVDNHAYVIDEKL